MWKDTNGSLTLEAAIILPFFLAFILALAGFIDAAKTEMAVQAAASETVKQLAHHYAPLDQLREGMVDQGDEIFHDVWESMPPALSQGIRVLVDLAEEEAAAHLLEPLVHYYASDDLNIERLTIQHVRLPRIGSRQHAYLSVEVCYEWRYPVPFLHIEKTIFKKAVERVWR